MTRPLQLLAGALGVVTVALSVTAMVIGSRVPTEDFLEGATWGAAVTVLAIIGSIIAVRRPRHLIGWLLMAAGLGEILAGTSNVYGQYRTAGGEHLPAADFVGWVGGSLWAFSAASLLIFLPLYFPTGRPPSPRWRWVGWVGAAAIVFLLLGTADVAIFQPELMGRPWEVIEAASAGRPLFLASEAGFPLIMATAPIALLSLIVRYVRSRGEERQQIKLLVFAVATTVAFIALINLTEVPRIVEAVGSALALPSIGIATMIAVLRYRLFEIDRVVSRTLTYGLLTVLLAGIYVGAITVLTTLTAPVTRQSSFAVAVATLLSAAAFQPARRRIQSIVDRRFNRARYDARHTVETFAASLRQEVELDDVRNRLADTVDTVLSPSGVSIWLRPGGTS